MAAAQQFRPRRTVRRVAGHCQSRSCASFLLGLGQCDDGLGTFEFNVKFFTADVLKMIDKQVTPLLIELLDDDPDPVLEDRIDHGVQQQAALALCKIYGVIDQCGRVYCNRASVEGNKAVKEYWLAKISE